MIVIGDKAASGSGSASPEPGDPEAEEPEHGIKCKYMRAARGYLSNTTFHGIAWVLEDVPRATKVFLDKKIKCGEV